MAPEISITLAVLAVIFSLISLYLNWKVMKLRRARPARSEAMYRQLWDIYSKEIDATIARDRKRCEDQNCTCDNEQGCTVHDKPAPAEPVDSANEALNRPRGRLSPEEP